MKIVMEALARQNYEGRTYIIGDEMLVASEGDALDLEAMHYARRKPKVPAILSNAPVVTREVETSQEQAEASVEQAGAAEPVEDLNSSKKRGKYRHREVTAQR